MRFTAGARLGHYDIRAPLGAGGMGEVYRAKDSRLGREVAIKVLHEHLARDPEAMHRFEQEARSVAALSHPNILAIHDFGSHGDVAFAVTELLEGESLRSRLNQAPLPWRKSVEIVVAVAEGLAAAHLKGIIHRDLKPENLFLTPDGRVKILDFGLAQVQVGAATQNYRSGEARGAVVGTTFYMSPEQVRGEPVHPTSDLFALGCLLLEMIIGRRVFERPTVAETFAAILHYDPPSLLHTGTDVPVELDRVIGHCLEKEWQVRIQSARDLSLALRDLLSSSGSSSSPRPARTGGVLDSVAILPFVNASGQPDNEYLSDGITENVINNLSQLSRLRVIARSTAFRYKTRDIDVQAAGRELGVNAVVSGRVVQRGEVLIVSAELVNVMDGTQLWGQRFNRKLTDVMAIEEEISQEISEKLRLKLSGDEQRRLSKRHTENAEAHQLYLRGRYHWNRRTDSAFKKGISCFGQAIQMDPGYGLAYVGLADCYNILGDYGIVPPREAFPRAKAAAIQALQIDEELAEAHNSLAYVLWAYDWNWTEAEKEFRRAIELNPNYATAHQWYAEFLTGMSRHQEVVPRLRQALDLDPLSLITNAVMGWFHYFARRYDEAIQQLTKTLEQDPGFARAHVYVGRALLQMAKFDDAIAAFQKGCDFSAGSPGHLAELGHAYGVAGYAEKARAVREQLMALAGQQYVSPYDIAIIHLGLGEFDLAFEWFEKAFQARSFYLVLIQLEPILDPARHDFRFRNLLMRVGLPA